MKSRYTQLFDQMTPPKTDEELLQDILSRREEAVPGDIRLTPRKRSFRKPVMISAAAVTALSVGVTAVGASTGWDFSKMFEGFYNKITEDYFGYVDTGIENQTLTADLSEMGINLGQTVDFGYGTVTFTGAIADSQVVMVMYDLTVRDEVLEEYYSKYSKEGAKPWMFLCSDVLMPGCNHADSFGYSLSMPDEAAGENGVGCSRTDAYFYQDGYLSKDMKLELEFNTFSMSASDHSLWEIELEEPVTLSLPLDFMNTDRIEVSPNVEITHDNYRYFLEDVVLTPLSIQWYTQPGERIDHLPMRSDPLIYRFKDGTEVKNYGITEGAAYNPYSGDREYHSALLDKPINLDDLASVTIGSYTINLE
ncbi:MAG: DUF4179 domain-containing protein [Oscillospiraceae bacterium]